jgi:protoporphyrinogen oxidase
MFPSTSSVDHAGAPAGPVVIIGGGPAGLTAAYELTRRGVMPVVLEGDDQVGGLAKTFSYRGFRFDVGGHRFFSQVPAVTRMWRELLGPDLLRRPRLSRILFQGRFYDYPLRTGNVLTNLGIVGSASVVSSYLRARAFPIRPETSFEDWVCNRFGRRLFEMFFQQYTEKVWGVPCSRIAAEWAAQRIRGLSLRTAVLDMVRPSGRLSQIKTLINQFDYPRLGPGMMWDACRARVEAAGGAVELNTRACEIRHDGRSRVTSVISECGGEKRPREVAHLISTMAVRSLVESLEPPAPAEVVAAAQRLKYRDFLMVALIVEQADVCLDNWIYIHEPHVRVARIQNFKNWSPAMVADDGFSGLGLEYFCSQGDALWRMSDQDLLALARRELSATMHVPPAKVVDGAVIRVLKAYPVYDEGYVDALAVVRSYLSRFHNLQLVGRNGTHKYNNQDHSMLTAMLAVRNLFGERHDLWAVNADQAYHENATSVSSHTIGSDIERLAASQPRVPTVLSANPRSPTSCGQDS